MNIEEAIKMMNEGFTLITKGFVAVVASREENKVVVVTPNTIDTKTCTLPEAATRLGIGRTTVSRLCDAGELKYTKDPRSGYRRIVTSSIVDYHRRLRAEAQKFKEAA